MSQVPHIVFSPLSKRWYCVTRYRNKPGVDLETGEQRAYIVASVKHDVTEQVQAILQADRAKRRRKDRRTATRSA